MKINAGWRGCTFREMRSSDAVGLGGGKRKEKKIANGQSCLDSFSGDLYLYEL